MSKFVETSYSNKIEILKFADHHVAVAVTVDDTGIDVNADGKKIVPAGTIVGGATKATLLNPEESVKKKNTVDDAANAEGVLLNDVDVTYGKAPGAMIIHGFIDLSKLPEAPHANAVTALKGIIFLK